jgi:hypothetical protein
MNASNSHQVLAVRLPRRTVIGMIKASRRLRIEPSEVLRRAVERSLGEWERSSISWVSSRRIERQRRRIQDRRLLAAESTRSIPLDLELAQQLHGAGPGVVRQRSQPHSAERDPESNDGLES